jgi:hypothetical protein
MDAHMPPSGLSDLFKAAASIIAALIIAMPTMANADTRDQNSSRTVTPQGKGITYYVSPEGSDANSGTSTTAAWRTLAQIARSTFHAGDSILFEGGKQFTGCLEISRQIARGTARKPVTIGAYGQGKFKLKADCANGRKAAIDVVGASGITIQDCVLSGDSGRTPYGIWIHNPFAEVAKNITVQRCDISGFYTTADKEMGAEIFVTGHPGGGLDGVNIIDNVLHGADGPTSPDNNGLYGYGRNKNVRNILYQGNVIYDIGGKPGGFNGGEGNGMIANGVTNGVIQHNVAFNLGANVDTCGGPTGLWAYNASHITIQFNEVYNVKPKKFRKGCDWDGFDLDGHVTDSVIQYNYAHDNWGAGLAVYIEGEWARNTIRYNVAINNATSWGASYFGNVVIANGGEGTDLRIYNNTLISEGPPNTNAGVSIQGNPKGAIIANNLIVALNGANYYNTGNEPPDVRILSNSYYLSKNFAIRWKGKNYYDLDTWRAATGSETIDGKSSAFVQDPGLDYRGLGQICQGYKSSCPAIALQISRKFIGAGLDLTKSPYRLDIGNRDYSGNKIPNAGGGSGYNVGAFGGMAPPGGD